LVQLVVSHKLVTVWFPIRLILKFILLLPAA